MVRLADSLALQLALVTLLSVGILLGLGARQGSFIGLWLTPDQQGQRAYDDLEFGQAADLFEDPAWKGAAGYAAGRYEEAAATYGRIPSAIGFFNRGDALMKSREYAPAIAAFEQAVAEDPDWAEARENLALARYVLEYVESSREAQDTGSKSEGADEIVYDSTKEGGFEIQVDKQTTIEQVSAEKWMRTVDTETRDFLRSRFALEAARGESR